jgi:hypothetical protein
MQSLRMLLLLKSATLFRVSRQISYGLYELLKTSAANIHSDTDWSIIFTLLECVGAGAHPPKVVGDNGRDRSDQGLLHAHLFLVMSHTSVSFNLKSSMFFSIFFLLNLVAWQNHYNCSDAVNKS